MRCCGHMKRMDGEESEIELVGEEWVDRVRDESITTIITQKTEPASSKKK